MSEARAASLSDDLFMHPYCDPRSPRYIGAGDFVKACTALKFLKALKPKSVDLFLFDPPYYDIVDESWDNQWETEAEYVRWLVEHVEWASQALKPNGSLLMFGAIGKHGSHPLFDAMKEIERHGSRLTYRNMIAWKKRRGYGKSHDYLFCREEIVWYSASAERTEVTFNIPLLNVKRGYKGWDPKHPAKSEFKRVSNVWDDIPELMRPKRSCQKPEPLMQRLIETHSNPGDLVVDFVAGYGTTGMVALKLGRRFIGCEAIVQDARDADGRCSFIRAHGQKIESIERETDKEGALGNEASANETDA